MQNRSDIKRKKRCREDSGFWKTVQKRIPVASFVYSSDWLLLDFKGLIFHYMHKHNFASLVLDYFHQTG